MRVMRRAAAPYFQRRATLRHDVSLRGAVIVEAGGASRAIGCRIVNLSLGGVRVELDEDCILPEKVTLSEDQGGGKYACGVRWRHGRTVGMSFMSQAPLAERKALLRRAVPGLAAEKEGG